jgi:hypothetical protein
MKRVARNTYRAIFCLPLLFLLIVLVLVIRGISADVGDSSRRSADIFVLIWVGGWIFLWLFLGPYVARWLLPFFISHLKCPGCGEVISAVNVWNCGCGFRDHKERHILAKVCPKCGERAGHLECPRCQCTILFW